MMTTAEPEVKVFLFQIPIIGIGESSDSAFRYAMTRLIAEPDSAIRGDVVYDEVEDRTAYASELGRVLAIATAGLTSIDTEV